MVSGFLGGKSHGATFIFSRPQTSQTVFLIPVLFKVRGHKRQAEKDVELKFHNSAAILVPFVRKNHGRNH